MTVETQYALIEYASVVIGASGQGSVVIGPQRPFERWHITHVAVTATGAATPQAFVYRGIATATNFSDGTKLGNLDSSDTEYDLQSGEFLTVTWTGASNGATCAVTVQGERFVKGQRAY